MFIDNPVSIKPQHILFYLYLINEVYGDLMKAKVVSKTGSKEKKVSRFLESIIKKEGIKADVKFYDERGLRLAAYTTEGPFRSHIMFSRELLKELTEKESKAIGLHEIAHVKYGHSGKKVLGVFYSVVPLVIILLAGWLIARSLGWVAPPVLANLVSVSSIIFSLVWVRCFGFKMAQRTELQADSYAKRKIGNSRVVTTALKKTMKYQWKQKKARKFWKIWGALFPIHPSFKDRVKNLKEDLIDAN